MPFRLGTRARVALLVFVATLAAPGIRRAEADDLPLRTAEQYRGRAPTAHPGRAWLWVPRVLLFPVYAFAEFAVRQPVLATGHWAEHSHLGPHIARAMHPTPTLWWGPSFDLDLGLRASVGGAVRWEDASAPGAGATVVVRNGGEGVWYLAARATAAAGPARVGLAMRFDERPDALFGGDAYSPPEAVAWRYQRARTDAAATLALEARSHVIAGAWFGLREDDTVVGAGIPLGVRQAVAAGTGRVSTGFAAARVVLDSRSRPGDFPGVRLDVGAHYGTSLGEGNYRFVRGEVELSGAFALPGGHAALGGMAYAADATSLGGAALPFTEEPTLGGDRVRGFLPGRFRGESAAAVELQLRVQTGGDLEAVFALGAANAFGRHFAGFDAARLAGEAWFALRSRTDPRGSVEILVGAGSTRFDIPFGVEQFRLALSLNRDLL